MRSSAPVPPTQPRNLLTRTAIDGDEKSRDIILCDLDAATPLGEPRPDGLKRSEGYLPPEEAIHLQVQSLSRSTEQPLSCH